MMKKKLVEAASSTFHIIIYENHRKKTNKLQKKKNITNGKDMNAVENVSTYAHIYITIVDQFSNN